VLACGSGTSSGGTTTGGSSTGGGSTGGGSSPKALFSDNFSDTSNGWDDNTSDTSSVGVKSGKYVIAISAESWIAWANPSKQDLKNIHIEVTVKNTGDAQDVGFGVTCDDTDGDFYYLAVSADGYYIIAKKAGSDTTALSDTENDSWLSSDKIPTNASSYQLGADCANGTLTLYVNGDEIASVDDSSYTSGNIGLLGATFKDSKAAEITFDSLEVTQLK
jgi:hypothetical protein